MKKETKDLLIVQENIFSKIRNFFRNIFKKNTEINNNIDNRKEKYKNNKNDFFKNNSYKENERDLKIINKIKKNPSLIDKMSLEELQEVKKVIENRQQFLDKKLAKLKTDFAIIKSNN